MPKDLFYLTTAIDYANGRPHLGHAYEKIGADVIARYRRLKGGRVFFMVGTDEHSLNVARQAAAAGKDPASYCAEMAETFKEAYRILGLSRDRFIRTDEEEHHRAVSEAVERVQAKGLIYKGTYEGWYCASCEAFLDGGDLLDGKCPVHPGRTVEWVAEDNRFFALSAFQEPLLRHFEANTGFLQPESRRNEVLHRLRAGLKDISISRASVDWGVSMPGAPDQVVYVWFDALISYLTGAGYADGGRFAKIWPPDVQIIGRRRRASAPRWTRSSGRWPAR